MKQTKEKILKGIAVSPGISMGSPYYYVHEILKVSHKKITKQEIEGEVAKYQHAKKKTKKFVLESQRNARRKAGNEAAKIFDAHLLILNDDILAEEIVNCIKEKQVSASYATSKIMKDYQVAMGNLSNEYFSQKAFDIEDVCKRIVRNILFEEQEHEEKHHSLLEKKSIIVSNNIFPSDVVNLDKSIVLGIATELGGKTSHAALLARSMEVPAVVGVARIQKYIKDAVFIIVDGHNGQVILNPTPKTIEKYKTFQHEEEKKLKKDLDYAKRIPDTIDGVIVNIASNIQAEEEVENVLRWSSQGVGLFRTEFLFEEKVGILTEEEQFKIYSSVAEKVYPDNVIIRLLDIGGDKLNAKIAFHEDNPFLGVRGLRLLLENTSLLKSHLRAILRASYKKNVWIMIPFLTDLSELRQIKRYITLAKHSLEEENKAFDSNIKVGAMIEIPSAAIMSAEIAKYVDFMSIGTNDLTQYTLAADRGNKRVSSVYDPLHPAVIRLIKMTIDAANKAKIYVGLCGELGGNPIVTPLLIGMGLRNLSVTPFMIPEIKKVIRNVKITDCNELAEKALTYNTSSMIRKELNNFFDQELKNEIEDWVTYLQI